VTGKATHTVWTPALHRGSWSYMALNALTGHKANDTFFWRAKYSFKHHTDCNALSFKHYFYQYVFEFAGKDSLMLVYVKWFFACKDYAV
jgi:hypothetical protein